MQTVTAQRRRPRRHEEDDFHMALVRLLGVILRHDVILHHSPNGGWRAKREAARLKAMGVRAGWPDLVVIWSDGALRMCALELKSRTGRVSQHQADLIAELQSAGCPTAVVQGIEAAVGFLRAHGVPMRQVQIAPA